MRIDTSPKSMILVATSSGKQVLTGMNKLIHSSAWKVNSANFAITEFYEVHTGRRMIALFLWWKGVDLGVFSKRIGKE